MALPSLNHHCGGQMQRRVSTVSGTRAISLPSIAKVQRRRAVAISCVSQDDSSSSKAPAQTTSPASTFISYAKLLALTGSMVAAMLLDKRPVHAAALKPEPITTVQADSSSNARTNKRGIWGKLKATATAPAGALDRLLFPDEPIKFTGSGAGLVQPEPHSAAISTPTAASPAAPAHSADPTAQDFSTAVTEELTGPLASSDYESSSAAAAAAGSAANAATLLPGSRQLAAAVAAASDGIAAKLAVLTEAVAPSWPAESAALGGVSRLPAGLSTAAAAEGPDAAVGTAAVGKGVGGDAGVEVSPELARQLVRGGYALAGLVVAVMAWQLAACVADPTKARQAQRAPKDDAFDAPEAPQLSTTASTASSTPPAAAAAAAAQSEPSADLAGQAGLKLEGCPAVPPELQGQNVVGPFCLMPQYPQQQDQQQQLPVVVLGPDDVLPLQLQGQNVGGPFCLKPQIPQQMQQQNVVLGPDDDLPPELQGENVVGPLCLLHPSLGPASHGHFSAAAVAAAAATADALRSEAEGMRHAAAAAVAAVCEAPLQMVTAGEVLQQGEHVMQAALAAAAQAEAEAAPPAAATDSDAGSSTPAATEQQEGDVVSAEQVMSVLLTATEPGSADASDDQPLFRVDLQVAATATDAAATAAAAVAESLEGRLAAEVVREALVAESCAAAAAAAAERAQIASHLIEDAIAAHSSSCCSATTSSSSGMLSATAEGVGSVAAAAGEGEEDPGKGVAAVGGNSSTTGSEGGAAASAAASWEEEVTCSLAAEVRAAEVAAGLAPDAAAATAAAAAGSGQKIPVSWQQPPASTGAVDANSSKGQGIPVSWQRPAASGSFPIPVQEASVSADQAIPVVWQTLVTPAGSTAAATAAAAAPAAAATPVEKQDIPVSWQQPAAAAPVTPAAADASTASDSYVVPEDWSYGDFYYAMSLKKPWAPPAADAGSDSPSLGSDGSIEVAISAGVDALAAEACAAEAAAAEAEAARAVAAAAVARVAAAKAAQGQQPAAVDQMIQEAKAAEAAAEEAAAACTAAAAAVARVAAAKAATAAAAAADVGSTPECADHPAASLADTAAVDADTTERLIQEAKAAEAAAEEAEAARVAAAAAVARMAAQKSALVRSAIEAVASAVGVPDSVGADTTPAGVQPPQAPTHQHHQDAGQASTAGSNTSTPAAAVRAAQAELIAEAIAAEAAAFAAEAAAEASGSAAAAEGVAGDAAELVKGWYCSSTTGPAQGSVSTPRSSSSSGSSISSSGLSGPPGPSVSVSWLLDGMLDDNDSVALAQLTQLAASLGHPAIGPVAGDRDSTNSSDTDAAAAEGVEGVEGVGDMVEVMRWFARQRVGEGEGEGGVAAAGNAAGVLLPAGTPVAAGVGGTSTEPREVTSAGADQSAGADTSDVDADAFKDEFAVPNDEEPLFSQPAAGGTPGLPLADVLDVASRQQMQAASETALQQAQARVVALYRARRTSSNSGTTSSSNASAQKPKSQVQFPRRPAAGTAASRRPAAAAPSKQLAMQLGVSDVALAMALAAFEGAEPGSPKSPQSSSSSAGADAAGVTVFSSSGDPYASAAAAISSSKGGQDGDATTAATATAAAPAPVPAATTEGAVDSFEVQVEQEEGLQFDAGEGESDSSSSDYWDTRGPPRRTTSSRLQRLREALSTPGAQDGDATTAVTAPAAAPAATAEGADADGFEVQVEQEEGQFDAGEGESDSSSSDFWDTRGPRRSTTSSRLQLLRDALSTPGEQDGDATTVAAPAAAPAATAEGADADGFEVQVEQEEGLQSAAGEGESDSSSGDSWDRHVPPTSTTSSSRLQRLVDALYTSEYRKEPDSRRAGAFAASKRAPAGQDSASTSPDSSSKADADAAAASTAAAAKLPSMQDPAAPADSDEGALKTKATTRASSGSSSAGSGSTKSRNNIVAAPAGAQSIEVVYGSLDEEADSFEVAVQRMVLNTARTNSTPRSSSKGAAPRNNSSNGSKGATAAAAPAGKAAQRAGSSAVAKGAVVEVPVVRESKGPVSWGVDITKPAPISVAGFDMPRSMRKAPLAGPPTAASVKSSSAKSAAGGSGTPDGSSGSSSSAKSGTTDRSSSSTTSKGGAVAGGEVRIDIKRPDSKANSFDVAVQRMVADTAARTGRRTDSTDSSSRSRSQSPSGPGKGFGRVVLGPVRVQRRPSTPGGLLQGRVPVYRSSSSGASGPLRPLPWWEQRAAARRTAGNSCGDWEGLKAPANATPAAAGDVEGSVAPAARKDGGEVGVQAAGEESVSPAASAAQAPSSIPVEWLETPAEKKRSQLRERAGAILKQQQGGVSTATERSSQLPAGWGERAGDAGSSSNTWAAVASEVTQELESELAGLLGSTAAVPAGSKDLSAPFATPKISVNGAAGPTKTQQLLQQQKQRLGQQKQEVQGPRRWRPQAPRQQQRGLGGKGSQA